MRICKVLVILGVFLLAGCVGGPRVEKAVLDSYLGTSISEAYANLGVPTVSKELPTGGRIDEWRWQTATAATAYTTHIENTTVTNYTPSRTQDWFVRFTSDSNGVIRQWNSNMVRK